MDVMQPGDQRDRDVHRLTLGPARDDLPVRQPVGGEAFEPRQTHLAVQRITGFLGEDVGGAPGEVCKQRFRVQENRARGDPESVRRHQSCQ